MAREGAITKQCTTGGGRPAPILLTLPTGKVSKANALYRSALILIFIIAGQMTGSSLLKIRLPLSASSASFPSGLQASPDRRTVEEAASYTQPAASSLREGGQISTIPQQQSTIASETTVGNGDVQRQSVPTKYKYAHSSFLPNELLIRERSGPNDGLRLTSPPP